MGKRPRVPAALHAEIFEYSALLRALRNQDTLDLTSQLIRAHSASAAVTEDDLLENEDLSFDEGESECPLKELTSQITLGADSSANDEGQSSLKRKRKSRPGSKKSRDTWTRWPLMAGEVHVPEWALEDEVKALAVQHIKRSLAGPDASADNAELLKDLDDDFANTLLPPASLGALADDAAIHLAHILALVAAHKPPAAESMQSRFAPFGWEMIMAVMSSSGLADANVMQNVQRRMEMIYDPSKSFAVHRIQTRSLARLGLHDFVEPHELSFLDWTYKPPPPPKRKNSSLYPLADD
ncbi:hypothetical protein DAEQUDRAFT_747138 [Daedalea quercina L-15889]|uniref:Uncharacterized protein n=1 Tax=Daedalea quercina L-15889 TaxID=1314783 RepID=A0A165M3J0_9APHY|nr:hypothetical protein DAEQUDRAFT_747138 [Daedalea quercina L-15889]